MNTVQKIARNTLALSLGDLTTALLGFFFLMYAARYLGAAGFGLLTFALAFGAIFNVFADVGLSRLAVREIARDRSLAPRYVGNVVILKVGLSLLVFGAVALAVRLLGYPPGTAEVVYIIVLSLLFDTLVQPFYAVFQAHEQMQFVTIGRTLGAALRLGGALLAMSRGGDVVTFALAFLVPGVVVLAYGAATARWRFARFRMSLDWRFCRTTLGQSWQFGLTDVFAALYYWAGSVMLASVNGDEAVGWFNAAYRFVGALAIIPAAYSSSVFPVMSRFYISSREALHLIHQRSLKYMLTLSVPMGIGLTILADRVVLLLFGPEYAPAAVALRVVVWCVVLSSASGLYAQLFGALNRQMAVAKVTMVSAVVNILLNVVLLPRYSYLGASVAAAATELVALVLIAWFGTGLGYRIPAGRLAATVGRVAAAGAVMGVFVFYFQWLVLWWLIPAAALLYFLALLGMRGIDREDRDLLLRIVRRRANGPAGAGDAAVRQSPPGG